MIAAFLLPFPLRGYRAPYLWVYYRLLSSFGEHMLFIASEDYLRDPESWRGQNRWEVQPGNAQRLEYQVPAREIMEDHEYQFLPESIFKRLLAENDGNPIAVLKRMLSERIPCLEAAFTEIFSQAPDEGFEAILTWSNCPSLSAAAEKKGIPVVHLEVGPLRWPQYRPTAYLDFCGVNGNTEAAQRYLKTNFEPDTKLDIEALRRFFYQTAVEEEPLQRADLGVVLQVDDDSNLLAFSHSYDNHSLLVYAHLQQPEGRVLVRGHPGSLFSLKPDWYAVDDSPDSVTFIRRCKKLLTINSSLGVEAILMQTPVDIVGDCAHRFILEANDRQDYAARLAFYLFAYLVPMQFIFEPDYLRFRLGHPSEYEIVIRHLTGYGLDVDSLQTRAKGSLSRLLEELPLRRAEL